MKRDPDRLNALAHVVERDVLASTEDRIDIADILRELAEPEPYERIKLSAPILDAIAGLIGVAGFAVPPLPLVRAIAEATEVFLRAELRRAEFPDAVHIEVAGEPTGRIVVPLFGDVEERAQSVQTIVAALEPVPPGEDTVQVAAEIAGVAVALTLQYGLQPEAAEALIRLAITEAKRGDADVYLAKYECGHEVVWLGAPRDACGFPDSEQQFCGASIESFAQMVTAGWAATAHFLEVGLRDAPGPRLDP